jgi:outer membrane protein OmpA-like peptidoglycan-associated protein
MNVKVRVMDMGGNVGTAEGSFVFDAPVVKRGGKYYIRTEDIIFSAYKYSLDSSGKETAKINMESIRKAAELYKSYPGYTIVIEGHALNVLLGKGTAAESREEKILEKLTIQRAETVKKGTA